MEKKHVYAQVALKIGEDDDLIKWRASIENWSAYIKRLVRKDILKRRDIPKETDSR